MYLQQISGRLSACIQSKCYKVAKGKVLANTLVLLLFKRGFLQSGSHAYSKFDHMFNLLLLEKHSTKIYCSIKLVLP